MHYFQRKTVQILLWVVLISYLSLFYFEQVNLVASDLGRHIQNGQTIIANKTVFTTNFYSYTHPDFPVINHHWLFGIFSAFLYGVGKFEAITIANLVIHLTIFVIFFAYLKRMTSTPASLIATIIAVPFITTRNEFRPEAISLLFTALYYIILSAFSRKKINVWQVVALCVPLQIIWVNTHIFFFLTFFILGCFGLDAVLKKQFSHAGKLIIVAIVLLLCCLVTPNGLSGMLAPLQIFTNYGFRVAENQGVLFLTKHQLQPIYIYVFFITFIAAITILFHLLKHRQVLKTNIAELLIAITFLLLSLKMFRLISLGGLGLMPLISIMLYHHRELIQNWWRKMTATNTRMLITSSTLISLMTLLLATQLFLPNKAMGLGLPETIHRSAQFYKEQNLSGPIFNNYDIGGYLIFHLYPQEKVFVDNRPEAYPAAFFQDIYIPAQESTVIWEDVSEKYDINTIFFYRHDLTPWAQHFLIERTKDSQWIPVFVDDYTIIFVRNSENNYHIIEKFELPREIFSVNKS